MKANEFVKKFGCEHSKYIADKWCGEYQSFDFGKYSTTYHLNDRGETSLIDLKRLVESHELVERIGGLDNARQELLNNAFNPNIDNFVQLKQAIFDVESCQ